jgi:hypothetical protein
MNDGLPEKSRIHPALFELWPNGLACAVHRQISFTRLKRAARLSLHFDGTASAMGCTELSGGTIHELGSIIDDGALLGISLVKMNA